MYERVFSLPVYTLRIMKKYKNILNASVYFVLVLTPLLLFMYKAEGVEGKSHVAPTAEEGAQKEERDGNVQDDSIQTLQGFEVQKIYDVPNEEQGSWVKLTVGPEGHLIASAQGEEGLFRTRVGGTVDSPEVDVQEFSLPVSGALGLEWAFGHLYANVNGEGLYRLKSHKDRFEGQFDVLEYLGGPEGRGEHGNHSVIPTDDGEGLYVVNGNHTPPPDSFASRVATWEEDILLPRNWDPQGHARGIRAPGGYIARIGPEAAQWEIISIGMRNTYDIAQNRHGELFAYDADMEWDMGMPWYRPTRLMHAVSGSDQGWRSGSGKWKPYFEDSLPPVHNVGPGSPTGLLFGTGAKFPARYQRALFGLDWTFGTIYAFHMAPDGASYRVEETEEFVRGSPLPLADAVVGADGYLYFITGGRGKESALYRVVYKGEKSTAPADPVSNPKARKARETRHRLEAFHGQEDPQAVDTAWPYLADEDRFIRHAARVAIEWQPVDTWAERALTEDRPQARVTALTALARVGSEEYRSDATESLMELDLAALSAEKKLSYLRAMSLVFQRLGDPSEQQREEITDRLNQLLPREDDRVNVELVRLLVYLDDPRVIDKALALMQRDTPPEAPDWDEDLLERSERYGGTIMEMLEDPPPTQKLAYASMLRNMRNGWTIDQRRAYFSVINEAADRAGGASYTGYLERMRDEALQHASKEEIAAVSDVANVSLRREPDFEINPPEGPGREWEMEEAVEVVENNLVKQNFERGRSLFHAIGCASCHRFDGYGGNRGPDLSSVGNRFGVEGILEEIIHPSRVISSQYSASEVVLENGDTMRGRVAQQGDSVKVYPKSLEASPTVVLRDSVQTISQVDESQMPAGLINPLNPEELRDLMAYMISGGDPDAEVYGPGEDAPEEGQDQTAGDAEETQEGE
jgi:putative heme-binding domain-containing protein